MQDREKRGKERKMEDGGEVEKRLSVLMVLQRDCCLGGLGGLMPPVHTLILTHEALSQDNSNLQASYDCMRYTECVVRCHLDSAVCTLCTQYAALSSDRMNFSRRTRLILRGRAAAVLHVKEHFHVIVKLSLEGKFRCPWCSLSTSSLSVVSLSVFPRPSQFVSKHSTDVHELVAANRPKFKFNPATLFHNSSFMR